MARLEALLLYAWPVAAVTAIVVLTALPHAGGWIALRQSAIRGLTLIGLLLLGLLVGLRWLHAPEVDLVNRADDLWMVLAAVLGSIIVWRVVLGRVVTGTFLRWYWRRHARVRPIVFVDSVMRGRAWSGAIWGRFLKVFRNGPWLPDDQLFSALDAATRAAAERLEHQLIAQSAWEARADDLVGHIELWVEAIARLDGRGVFRLTKAQTHPLALVLEGMVCLLKAEGQGLRGPRVGSVLEFLRTTMVSECGPPRPLDSLATETPNRYAQHLLELGESNLDRAGLYRGQLQRERHRRRSDWSFERELPQERLGGWIVMEVLRQEGLVSWAHELALLAGGGRLGLADCQLAAWTAHSCAEVLAQVELPELAAEKAWLEQMRDDRWIRARPPELFRREGLR